MSLKPWREIARPHKDVLHGTFKQSEFAADISQVANGTAPPEYQDAEAFFARTFITEGMRLLLISVAQRLAGQGGDPVSWSPSCVSSSLASTTAPAPSTPISASSKPSPRHSRPSLTPSCSPRCPNPISRSAAAWASAP